MCYILYMLLDKFNIDIVDSGLIRSCFAGTYILKEKNEVALIEVSTSHAVPKILEKLKELNIQTKDVKYLFITHIHLDHAGGAGTLLMELPNAKLIVHPSGSKHMIDPSKLIDGANMVYGHEVVKKDYGTITPINKERVIECQDNQIFYIGDRELKTIYTPGHARHHIAIFDSSSKGVFTGDSLGLTYPELDINGKKFYQPTTTPTAFEYDKMLESINKIMKLEPNYIFFTHYGFSDEPKEVENQIITRLKDYIHLVKSGTTDLEKRLGEYFIKESKKHGSKLSDNKILELFDIDIKLNAMGLTLWNNRDNA